MVKYKLATFFMQKSQNSKLKGDEPFLMVKTFEIYINL